SPPPSALEPPVPEAAEPMPIETIQSAKNPPSATTLGMDLSGPSESAISQRVPVSGQSPPQSVWGLSETPDAPLELDEPLDLGPLDDLSVPLPQAPKQPLIGRDDRDSMLSDASGQPSGEPLLPSSAAPSAMPQNAAWYASLPGGTTVGPMSAAAVVQGLQQGQFALDSLVWRDGWTQWQPLAAVLAQLNPSGSIAAPSGKNDPLADALNSRRPSDSSSYVHGRRRTRNETRSRVSLILMGLVIILFALMVYVLSMKPD